MIHGIGVDLVELARFTKLHERHGERLARRLLADEEWADYQAAADRPRFLGKRFAAKEALAKALGTGLRAPVTLPHIRVIHDALGRPGFAFAPILRDWLISHKIGPIHLSISDETGHAVAFVTAETATSPTRPD